MLFVLLLEQSFHLESLICFRLFQIASSIVSKFDLRLLACRLKRRRLTNETTDKHVHIFPPYINTSPRPFLLSLRPPPPLYRLPPKGDSKLPFSSTRYAAFMLAMVRVVDTVTQPSMDI